MTSVTFCIYWGIGGAFYLDVPVMRASEIGEAAKLERDHILGHRAPMGSSA